MLQGNNLADVEETWLFRQDNKKECSKFDLGRDDEQSEDLWTRICGQINICNLVMGVSHQLPNQKIDWH